MSAENNDRDGRARINFLKFIVPAENEQNIAVWLMAVHCLMNSNWMV